MFSKRDFESKINGFIWKKSSNYKLTIKSEKMIKKNILNVSKLLEQEIKGSYWGFNAVR